MSSTVPPERKQSPVGDQAQRASAAPFRSGKYLVEPLLGGASLVRRAQGMLDSMQGGAHGASTGTVHGGTLTQRAPPPRIPLPFSGFGPVMMGGVASGSSSGFGGAPLLAVVVCLCAALFGGRSRAYDAFLRPGTVPPLALERPG